MLIDNLAQSDACYGGEFDRSGRGSSSNVDFKLEKLNERFDKLSRMLMGNQRQVAYVENNQEGNQESYQDGSYGYGNEDGVEGHEETNYIGNYNNNFKPFNNAHPNLSYRSNNVENPQDQVYPNQAQTYQRPPFNNNNQPRPQQGYNQPRPSFQQGGYQPRGNFQGGFQPRNFNPQPQDADVKSMLKTIMESMSKGQNETERRFKEMQVIVDQVTSNIRSLEGQVAQVASTSKQPSGTFPGKAETNPKAPCNVVLKSDEDSMVKDTRLKSMEESENIKKLDDKVEGSQKGQDVKKHVEDPREKFQRIVEMVEREERLEKEALNSREEASKPFASPTLKTLPKQGDPGKFNIPCFLGGRMLEDALCDSGSYVNVISWDLVKELKLKGMKPSSISLVFGDASQKTPKGIIEDYPIKVGNCIIPTDLLVLDMEDSKERPVLLGAPFLLTAGAIIDYEKGVVMLKNVNAKVSYAVVPPHVSCETFTTRDAFVGFQEATKVEITSSLVMEILDVGMSLENEETLDTRACSKEAIATLGKGSLTKPRELITVKAVTPFESSDFGLEKLFEEGVLPKKTQKIKVAKGVKKEKKLKKVPREPTDSQTSNLTFKPLKLVDGKLECKVKGKGKSRPFAKVRIVLDPISKTNDASPLVNAKMATLFGIKMEDRGPIDKGSCSTKP